MKLQHDSRSTGSGSTDSRGSPCEGNRTHTVRLELRMLALFALLVGAGSVPGCSTTPGSGTTGRTLTLQTVAVVGDDLHKPMVNAQGWSIELHRALLSVGGLYYFQGDPVLSQGSERSGRARYGTAGPSWQTSRRQARWPEWQYWSRWAAERLEGTAHAHPGHYAAGAAMGEMTSPLTLDLLTARTILGVGSGVSGWTHSARFTWQSPPAGPLAAALGANVVLTEGVARKGVARVHFLAKATAEDVRDGDKEVQVAGCTFGSQPGQVGVEMVRDGTVTLTLHPSVWFDTVDFAYVIGGSAVDGGMRPDSDAGDAAPDGASAQDDAAPSDAATDGSDHTDQPIDLTGSLAWQAFLRGLKKGTAYAFSYAPGAAP